MVMEGPSHAIGAPPRLKSSTPLSQSHTSSTRWRMRLARGVPGTARDMSVDGGSARAAGGRSFTEWSSVRTALHLRRHAIMACPHAGTTPEPEPRHAASRWGGGLTLASSDLACAPIIAALQYRIFQGCAFRRILTPSKSGGCRYETKLFHDGCSGRCGSGTRDMFACRIRGFAEVSRHQVAG